MRFSCNACRVLRKGCSQNCTIRPCLQWIKSPQSQANATVFLAKFYGRAGLINLINAGPQHLRPAVFRSLLYEACGRIANPIYGSVGLLWSGSWQLCQDAVEAVLQGSPVTRIASGTDEMSNAPPSQAYDIRHVSKDDNSGGCGSHEILRVRTCVRFKRSAHRGKARGIWIGSSEEESGQNESALCHQSESREMVAEEKSEAEVECKIGLELTLGHEPVDRSKNKSEDVIVDGAFENCDAGVGMDLRLDYPAAA